MKKLLIAFVGAFVLLVALAGGTGLAPVTRVVHPVGAELSPVKVVVGAKRLGPISRYLFGANLLWPYNAEGAFDAGTDRFYPAFIDAVRALGISALRYPAGITSDSFDWRRAVGPLPQRQPNEPYGVQAATQPKPCCTVDGPVPSVVGPDEFGRLLGQVGAVGTITVNFVTGAPQQAADFVAYMTAPYTPHPSSNPGQASYWAALRARDGHRAPYNVPYWEVGNEQDGPGQYGWRSGRLVSLGRHEGRCSRSATAVCLYAFGGTTAFYRQAVGTFADEQGRASRSTGARNQSFYVYFPPVVPHSQTVFVSGRKWAPVQSLSRAGRHARVYTFDPASGQITFGNGTHGAVPRRGDHVTVSYRSGPHGGFVEFYAAMKKMNRRINVCEAEEQNATFLAVMGKTYRFDCVELHKYAKPLGTNAPMTEYEEGLMSFPLSEGTQLTALQRALRHYSGRDVPVVLTEYGQLVEPMPVADPDFNLSLDESILVASQLTQWVDHDLPLAEKYLLDSTPFLGTYRLASTIGTPNIGTPNIGTANIGTPNIGTPGTGTPSTGTLGLSVDSAMIVGPGPPFLVEPTGEVVRLMSQLAGAQRLTSAIVGDPVMEPTPSLRVPVLQALAATTGAVLDVLVINASPSAPVRAAVDVGPFEHGRYMLDSVLDGPGPLAYNTTYRPRAVTVFTRFADVGTERNFWWVFPAHSVTLLQLQVPVRAPAQRGAAPLRHRSSG